MENNVPGLRSATSLSIQRQILELQATLFFSRNSTRLHLVACTFLEVKNNTRRGRDLWLNGGVWLEGRAVRGPAQLPALVNTSSGYTGEYKWKLIENEAEQRYRQGLTAAEVVAESSTMLLVKVQPTRNTIRRSMRGCFPSTTRRGCTRRAYKIRRARTWRSVGKPCHVFPGENLDLPITSISETRAATCLLCREQVTKTKSKVDDLC